MKKNFYLAAFVSEKDKNNKERNYAKVIKASKSDNMLSVFNRHKNLKSANICETKKEAERLVKQWNYDFKQNGTYMFDNYPF